MKKSITLLLVLVLVAGAAFAAPSFSGEAAVNYKVPFDGTNATVSGYDNDTSYLTLSMTDELYKITFRTWTSGNNLNYLETQAAINVFLDKAFAKVGVDLPVGLTGYFGNASVSGFYAYDDPTSIIDNYYDGFNSRYNSRNDYPIGLDVTYEKLLTVRGIVDFINTNTADTAVLLSAKTTPVEGINVALSYANNPQYSTASSADEHGINVSAKADVATLADLDFNLAVSGIGFVYFDDSSANKYLAAVTGGKDAVSGYVEYTNIASVNSLNVGGGYQLTDDVKLTAGVGLEDLSDISVTGYGKVAYRFADTFDTYVKGGYDGTAGYVSTGFAIAF